MTQMQKQKTGLVLEGGAMRGMFTAGVIDVLLENNILLDGAIGVSAGAAFGCNYKSKQIGRVIRYNKRFAKDARFGGVQSLLKTGNLYNAEFCYRTVPLRLDVFDTETYQKVPMEFWCVATDCKDGKPLYHRCEKMDALDLEWVRASASMPIVSKPVQLVGKEMLDGGISDPIPLSYFESVGYTKNVVVLTQPASYRKQPQKGMKAMARLLKKYPAIVAAMEQRHTLYNEEVAYVHQKEAEGDVFVIQPAEDLEIGKTEHNPDKLEEVYQIGRNTCLQQLEALQKFLREE